MESWLNIYISLFIRYTDSINTIHTRSHTLNVEQKTTQEREKKFIINDEPWTFLLPLAANGTDDGLCKSFCLYETARTRHTKPKQLIFVPRCTSLLTKVWWKSVNADRRYRGNNIPDGRTHGRTWKHNADGTALRQVACCDTMLSASLFRQPFLRFWGSTCYTLILCGFKWRVAYWFAGLVIRYLAAEAEVTSSEA